MSTDAHGTTYLYVTPDGQRREIGVIRGLGDSWIVGWDAGGAHHRVKTPRLPAGTDPAALQTALDAWAGERGLPIATWAAAPAISAPAAAERQPSEAVTTIPPLTALPAVPDGWAAKAALVDQCVAAGQRLTLWIAVIISRAREDFATPGEWVDACTSRWGWQKAYLHHMHAVGGLLIRECDMSHLFTLDVYKLLAISRLPPSLVRPFMERARPAERSRDEVRAAVNRWLAAAGEPTDDAPAAPPAPPPPPDEPPAPAVQQDFLDALFAAASTPPLEFRQRVVARASEVSDALPVINRAVVVLDAMIPRLDLRRPEALGTLAAALRKEVAAVEAIAAGLGRQLPPATQE